MSQEAALKNLCVRCGANLVNGSCEYCGLNSVDETKDTISDETFTLSGITNELTVTKEACAFKPKIGAESVIANKEIKRISITQAHLTGTGELSIITTTGIKKKINFLFPQNVNMEKIASYLSHVAPDAKFTNVRANSKTQQQETEQQQAPIHQQAQIININNIITNTGINAVENDVPKGKPKKKSTALILCLLLGIFGVHKFYEGKIGIGILYLCTLGLCAIGVIIDFFVLLFKPKVYYVKQKI